MVGIIPAAGKGTRLGSFTEKYPKVLHPYQQEPILFKQIDWLHECGCDNVVIVANHKEEYIEKAIALYKKPSFSEVKINIAHQDELNGSMGSVETAIRTLKATDMYGAAIVLFGDLVPLRSNIKFNFNTVSYGKSDNFRRWVMLDVDELTEEKVVRKFIEKPTKDPGTDYYWSGITYVSMLAELVDATEKVPIIQGKETCLSRALKLMQFDTKYIPILNFGTTQECQESSYEDHRDAIEVIDRLFGEKS